MKKKIDRLKLKLVQEVVRTLAHTELPVIQGGNNPPSNRSDCHNGTC